MLFAHLQRPDIMWCSRERFHGYYVEHTLATPQSFSGETVGLQSWEVLILRSHSGGGKRGMPSISWLLHRKDCPLPRALSTHDDVLYVRTCLTDPRQHGARRNFTFLLGPPGGSGPIPPRLTSDHIQPLPVWETHQMSPVSSTSPDPDHVTSSSYVSKWEFTGSLSKSFPGSRWVLKYKCKYINISLCG